MARQHLCRKVSLVSWPYLLREMIVGRRKEEPKIAWDWITTGTAWNEQICRFTNTKDLSIGFQSKLWRVKVIFLTRCDYDYIPFTLAIQVAAESPVVYTGDLKSPRNRSKNCQCKRAFRLTTCTFVSYFPFFQMSAISPTCSLQLWNFIAVSLVGPALGTFHLYSDPPPPPMDEVLNFPTCRNQKPGFWDP